MILFLAALQLPAQEEKNDTNEQGASLIDKLSLGGNFSLQFGNVTFIDISPMVGYRFTDRFTAGPGITYRYLKFRGFEGSSVYGGSLFARHIIGSQFFAHAQYESLNAEYLTSLQDPVQRGWVPGFFLGGGIFQPLGRRGVVNISALYNLMYDPVRSPYNSPWVFNVGFML
jgi:hypothetical protein